MSDLKRVDDVTWEIPPTGGMRVPGRIFASDALMEVAAGDGHPASGQRRPSAGIVEASFAMPDIHWGYGFPIGGVAATDIDDGGWSRRRVGFDICCGVRLLASDLTVDDFRRHRDAIMANLDARIPRGPGTGAIAPESLVPKVLSEGAAAAVEAGYGWEEDLERCEERGTSQGGDPAAISEKAMTRGRGQLGSLGAGNHFLEVQYVDRVVDPEAAEVFGLREGAVTVMIHCGSRGLGHQTCTDHLRLMGQAMARHGITVPDRQLACVPVRSEEGSDYMAALAAASNSPGPTATSSPTPPGSRSPTLSGSRPAKSECASSSTSPTTSPRSSGTRWEGPSSSCACIARAPHVRSGRATPPCPRTSARWASPSSSPDRWEPPRGCCAGSRATRRSTLRPTAPAGS